MNANDRGGRDSFLAQTEAYLSGNDLAAALDLARERLERIPGDLDARMAICRIWIELGKIDEAREMLGDMEEILACLS
ncbi:MAG: tetratricopeptide repeat protein, partial [Pseudomonadota bacterium]